MVLMGRPKGSKNKRFTPNEFHVKGKIAYMDLYDKGGKVVAQAILDATDIPLVQDRKWHRAMRPDGKFYVKCHGHGHKSGIDGMYLHRLLMGVHGKKSKWVDHMNRNMLDNRRANLRLATVSQSNHNKVTKRGKLKGVYPHGDTYWTATITKTFRSQKDAIAQRRAWERMFHGEFAMDGCCDGKIRKIDS